ncbi:uncharacterized protein BDZ99DRAFT_388504, partial [Mytilinidion resinicola]
FLVKKKNRRYYFINAVIKINTVTIYNANLLLIANKYLEKFAGCKILLLINFFSSYN